MGRNRRGFALVWGRSEGFGAGAARFARIGAGVGASGEGVGVITQTKRNTTPVRIIRIESPAATTHRPTTADLPRNHHLVGGG